MRRLGILIASVILTVLANVRVYDVPPYKCCEGWTETAGYVAETFVACADSLVYVEFFAGQKPAHSAQGYLIQVLDGGTELYRGNATDTLQWAFVRVDLERRHPEVPFVRGKTYTLKISHTGIPPQRINYFYDPRETTYAYGCLARDQHVELHNDLVCRIYGILKPVEKTFFGMDEPNFVPWTSADSANRRRLRNKNGHLADSAGIGSMMLSSLRWQDLWGDTLLPPGCTLDYGNWCDCDARLWVISQEAHARPVVNIVGVAPYASSRDTFVMKRIWVPDTSGDTAIDHWEYKTVKEKTPYCAPLGLWNSDTTNYWKMFILSMITHLDGDIIRRPDWPGGTGRPYDNVHIFEIWNEPNDSCPVTCRRCVDAFATGWWRRPNREYQPEEYSGLYGLCRLYVRMAYVAESVIHHTLPEYHQNDTILIGAVHRCFDANDIGLSKGIEFIRNCYQIAMSEYGRIFWDGVSIHPYQNGHDFNPVTFEIMAESVRAVAREYGDYDCLVWNSEAGVLDYPGWDPEIVNLYHQGDARRYLPQMFATGIASAELPGARYDACQWWWYSTGTNDSFGLIGLINVPDPQDTIWPPDADWQKFSAYYAVKQMTEELIDWQYESRISLGDSVRIYQFTHPVDGRRKWVGWRVQDEGRGSPKSALGFVPVRTDSVYVTDELGTTLGLFSADETGWYVDSLGPMVTYIKEPNTQVLRPDLRVDSIRLVPSQPQVGMPLDIHFWVKNYGNRSLPRGVAGGIGVYRNGVRLEPPVPFSNDTALAPGCGQVFVFHIEAVPDSWRGLNLFSVVVNPNREFVELEFDDNAGYIYTTISLLPVGRFYATLPAVASNKQNRS